MASGSSSQQGDNATSSSYPNLYRTTTTPYSRPQPSSRAVRLAMVTAHTTDGAIHNPSQLPPVDGEWQWLEESDEVRAHELGYEDQIDVTLARERGQVGSSADGNIPNVTFRPNPAHLNPNEEPEDDGDFEFLSSDGEGSARTLAWTQLGGQEAYGFEKIQRPTARQVWQLRQEMLDERLDVGVFEGIDIVWNPVGVPPPDVRRPPYTQSTTPSEPENPEAPDLNQTPAPKAGEPVDRDVFDPDPPHLRHDPLNRGENDQTGASDLRRYRTRKIDGKTYTNDVSSASVKRPEPHKLWFTDSKGNWKKWLHADTMDWSSKEKVSSLNAWRDQSQSRHGWPAKRTETRGPYPPEQKEWLFGFVKDNRGNTPSQAKIKDIMIEFNLRWNANRTQAAISAVCSRLSEMHKATGGKFVAGVGQGGAKRKEREERERKRREREEAGEEVSPPPKRRRQSKKRGDEDEEGAGGAGAGDGAAVEPVAGAGSRTQTQQFANGQSGAEDRQDSTPPKDGEGEAGEDEQDAERKEASPEDFADADADYEDEEGAGDAA